MRFSAWRANDFNEYLYNFFKSLSVERMRRTEAEAVRKLHPPTEVEPDIELGDYVLQRRCPHRNADLSVFGEIEQGRAGDELVCTLHGWRFDCATGRCLTADDRPLRIRRRDADVRTAQRGEPRLVQRDGFVVVGGGSVGGGGVVVVVVVVVFGVADGDLDELRRRRTERIGDRVAQREVGVRRLERRGDRERQAVDDDRQRCRIVVDRQHQRIAVGIDGVDHAPSPWCRPAITTSTAGAVGGELTITVTVVSGETSPNWSTTLYVNVAVPAPLPGWMLEAVVREPLDRAHLAVGERQRVGHRLQRDRVAVRIAVVGERLERHLPVVGAHDVGVGDRARG